MVKVSDSAKTPVYSFYHVASPAVVVHLWVSCKFMLVAMAFLDPLCLHLVQNLVVFRQFPVGNREFLLLELLGYILVLFVQLYVLQ